MDKNAVLKTLQRLRKDAGATPERFELHALELMRAWGVEDGQAAVERLKEVLSTLPPAERDILTMSLGLTNGKGVGLQQRRQHYLTGRKYATSDSDLYRKERDATDALVEALLPTVEEMLTPVEWIARNEDAEGAEAVLSLIDGRVLDNSPLTPDEQAQLEAIANRAVTRPAPIETEVRWFGPNKRDVLVATMAPGDKDQPLIMMFTVLNKREYCFGFAHEDGHETSIELTNGNLIISSLRHRTPKILTVEMGVKEVPVTFEVPEHGDYAVAISYNVIGAPPKKPILIREGGRLIVGDRDWIEPLAKSEPDLTFVLTLPILW